MASTIIANIPDCQKGSSFKFIVYNSNLSSINLILKEADTTPTSGVTNNILFQNNMDIIDVVEELTVLVLDPENNKILIF